MTESQRQTRIMIGVAMLVVAGIMIYIALSQPRVYVNDDADVSAEIVVNSTSTEPSTESYTNSLTSDTQISYPINLNTATFDELKSVDGIGEQRAYQIIAYRESNGAFDSVEEIKNI